jgi:hypothetical protein
MNAGGGFERSGAARDDRTEMNGTAISSIEQLEAYRKAR